MDSYVQRQISQSDCEISRNCGKKKKLNKASIEVSKRSSIFEDAGDNK